jgi:transcriptional regulator with XRE-family HTH domain
MTETKKSADAKRRRDPVDVRIGRRLRRFRLALELTQADVGGALGRTHQSVAKMERGSVRIAASDVHRLSLFLGVPVGAFYEQASGRGASSEK